MAAVVDTVVVDDAVFLYAVEVTVFSVHSELLSAVLCIIVVVGVGFVSVSGESERGMGLKHLCVLTDFSWCVCLYIPVFFLIAHFFLSSLCLFFFGLCVGNFIIFLLFVFFLR